ncbi:cellulose synthase-like protein E6 [Cucumis melo var. makuwa]|uniref:Cellulose synthase-like protein E6 n=1 Tax=Cucumis melo var. makuwa TaxID=1194695 RepID=A0A5D3DHS8_CUCMM|nr:cellulose synthase-like protein E6 [Cucumis melo var. makuwa]
MVKQAIERLKLEVFVRKQDPFIYLGMKQSFLEWTYLYAQQTLRWSRYAYGHEYRIICYGIRLPAGEAQHKFNIQPRSSPAAYFASQSNHQRKEVVFIQKLYKELESRINVSVKLVIGGRDPKATDVEGDILPTLVYLASEKRPPYFHNFKAGAMNALKGHETAYIQFPQKFHNVTKNEIYGSSLRVMNEVEFPGVDDFGGPRYHGLGCFHKKRGSVWQNV